MAVPSSSGTQNKGPLGRISVLKNAGLDVLAMYPAKPEHTPESDKWTWDALLPVAEACKNANMTVAIGLGQTTDSVDSAGSLFRAFGAALVDREGNIQVGSDKMRQLLEYGQKLVKLLPPDAVSFDDASNNRALISGKSALIFNPPSAWAVAKRDAPQVAADCWTFPAPAGPEGRFEPYLPYFWGIWKFAQNKSAGEGADRLSFGAPAGRGAMHRSGGLRPAAFQLDARFQGLGGSRASEGGRVQLSDPAFPQFQAKHRGIGGVAGGGCADL